MSEWPPRLGGPPESSPPPLGRALRGSLRYSLRWLVVAVIAGVVIGPVVAAFEGVLAWCEVYLFRFWLLGLPLVGALAVGWLVRYEQGVAGNGTQEYIGTFERGARLAARLSPLKWMASLLTLGTGGSGGKAGPMILVGASAGSALSRRFGVDRGGGLDEGALVGAGAALGALFGTPLAGGLMAAEILYPEGIHYWGLFPAVIASCVGAAVRKALSTPHIAYAVQVFQQQQRLHPPCAWWYQWAGWVLTAVVTAAGSLGFVLLYGWAERQFRGRLRKQALRPVAGAAVCWVTGVVSVLLVPGVSAATSGVFGTGERLLGFAVGGGSLVVLVWLLLGKAVATASTVGSGGSGGLVFPALILGALGGALVQAGCQAVGLPTPVALPLVGMAAALAAVLNVPVAGAVLLIGLFGTEAAAPVALGAVIGFVIGRPWVVYNYSQAGSDSQSP